MFIDRGFNLVAFVRLIPELDLHFFLLALESVESLELRYELVINLESLLHYRKSQFVLPANPLPVPHVAVLVPDEEVNKRQKISLLGAHLLLGL